MTTSPSSASEPSEPTEKTKVWVAEQGHYENTTEKVWIPNIITITDKPAYNEKIVVGTYTLFSDGHIAYTDEEYAEYSEKMAKAGTPVSYSIQPQYKTVHHDAVTHTEDRGYYEDKVTGKHWVVDEAGHYE